jgi:hypothetical protein
MDLRHIVNNVKITSNIHYLPMSGTRSMSLLMSRFATLLLRRRWRQFAPGQDDRTVSYVYAIMMMT